MHEQINKHVTKQAFKSIHTRVPKCNHTDAHTTACHKAYTIFNRADIHVVVCFGECIMYDMNIVL